LGRTMMRFVGNPWRGWVCWGFIYNDKFHLYSISNKVLDLHYWSGCAKTLYRTLCRRAGRSRPVCLVSFIAQPPHPPACSCRPHVPNATCRNRVPAASLPRALDCSHAGCTPPHPCTCDNPQVQDGCNTSQCKNVGYESHE
jgi:hypothetical protein